MLCKEAFKKKKKAIVLGAPQGCFPEAGNWAFKAEAGVTIDREHGVGSLMAKAWLNLEEWEVFGETVALLYFGMVHQQPTFAPFMRAALGVSPWGWGQALGCI